MYGLRIKRRTPDKEVAGTLETGAKFFSNIHIPSRCAIIWSETQENKDILERADYKL